MAGFVKQEDIEMVSEDLIGAYVESMSEEDREASRRFFLREAERFSSPQEDKEDEKDECECEGEWCECEDEEEEEEEEARPRPVPAPRHYSDPPDADTLRECISDLKEETTDLEDRNSLQREMNTLMVTRNTLTVEERRLREGMLAAEREWGELLRKVAPQTGGPSDLIKEIRKVEERLERVVDYTRGLLHESESEVRKLKHEAETRKVTWWRRWFLWWL